MPRRRIEDDNLSLQGISHGFFTRVGGVSEGIYASLNCGFGSNDEASNVLQNRSIVSERLGVPGARVNTPYQTHSSDAVVTHEGWGPDAAPKADAVVTNTPNIVIGVLTADCAPVLFVDPINKVVAAAHSGWRGAVGGVLENTVETMRSLGAQRRHIVAVVGPCIGQKNYEVGREFYDQFMTVDQGYSSFFSLNEKTNNPHFDLSGFAVSRLEKIGVKKAIATPYCTYEDETQFFSYRRNTHNSMADYGRQVSAIVIN